MMKTLPEPLTANQRRELFERLADGDVLAREELINGSLRLACIVANKYSFASQASSFDLDDVFSESVIGLIKAIDNFDASYNTELSTYAVPKMRGEIGGLLRDRAATTVTTTRTINVLAHKARHAEEEL